jgi:hypothetical protein
MRIQLLTPLRKRLTPVIRLISSIFINKIPPQVIYPRKTSLSKSNALLTAITISQFLFSHHANSKINFFKLPKSSKVFSQLEDLSNVKIIKLRSFDDDERNGEWKQMDEVMMMTEQLFFTDSLFDCYSIQQDSHKPNFKPVEVFLKFL